jgi:hypothetical protein
MLKSDLNPEPKLLHKPNPNPRLTLKPAPNPEPDLEEKKIWIHNTSWNYPPE